MKYILDWVTVSINLLINLKEASLKVTSERKSDRLILIPGKEALAAQKAFLEPSGM